MALNKRDEIVARLQESRRAVEFRTVELTKVRKLDEEGLTFNGDELPATGWARQQLLRELKIPQGFYWGLDTPARDEAIRSQRLVVFGGTKSERKIRIVEGACTAVLPLDYPEVAVEDLVKTLPDWDYVASALNTNQQVLRYRAVDRGLSVVDDICHGFDFVYSEVGGADVLLDALLIKLICINGMVRVRRDGASYFRVPPMTLATQPELFEVVIGGMADKLQVDNKILLAAITSAQDEMLDVKETVEGWYDRKLPSSVPTKVLAMWEKEGAKKQMSVEELAQLVAQTGGTVKNYRTRLQFERLAGRMLNLGITTTAN